MDRSAVAGARLGIPWRPVAAFSGGGLLMVAVASVWVASPVAGVALEVSIAALAGATAYLLDEPAAEAVAATPIKLRTRSAARLAVAVIILAAGVLALGGLALRANSSARLAIALPVTGCVLVAVAAAATLRRRAPERVTPSPAGCRRSC